MKPSDLLLQAIQVTPAFLAMGGVSSRMNSLQQRGLGRAEDGRTIHRRLQRQALKAAKKNGGKQ